MTLEEKRIKTKQLVVFEIGKEKFCIDKKYVSGIVGANKLNSRNKEGLEKTIESVIEYHGRNIPVISLIQDNIRHHYVDDGRIIIVRSKGKYSGFLADKAKIVTYIENTAGERPYKDQGFYSICRLDDSILVMVDIKDIMALSKISTIKV
jgi:chemotaxis signal transduction protein